MIIKIVDQYEIKQWEMELARSLAGMRKAVAMELRTNYVNTTDRSPMENEVMSVAGEFGYARMVGLDLNMEHTERGMGMPDYIHLGITLDVKTTPRLENDLMVTLHSPPRMAYASMVLVGRMAYYRGYVWHDEVVHAPIIHPTPQLQPGGWYKERPSFYRVDPKLLHQEKLPI